MIAAATLAKVAKKINANPPEEDVNKKVKFYLKNIYEIIYVLKTITF